MFQRISEPIRDSKEGLGNKGKFLCLMYEAGFLVPDGVILDAEEYRSFLRAHDLEKEITRLLKSMTKENVSETSIAIGKLFQDKDLPEETIERLKFEISETDMYAVRSSGSKEDLLDYSFAGQYETYLNVQGIEAISKAVVTCYQSMFSERILEYFVSNHIDTRELTMAVIIQKMVPSEYSGICFTVNPLTGNDKEMSIEVAEGLGENIVSGKAIPEQYYYNWYEKKGKIGAVNHILTEEQLTAYGEIFLKVQLLFGYPCDIEFAIYEGRLYLLQARRITKLNYGMLTDTWSTADFKDGGVSASVCTPYMWSLYEYIWEFTLRKFLLDSKILTKKEVDKKLGDMFYGRCYWNVCVVKLALSKVIGYKEREFDSEYGVRITYEGDGQVTRPTFTTLFAILRMFFAQKKILKERNDNAELYKKDLLNKYETYKKKYDKKSIKDIKREWYQLTKKTYLQSEATYFWQIFINTVHQSLYKDSLLKYVTESEYLSLLGAIDNISHMLPFYEMWDISRSIRESESDKTFWESASADNLLEYVNREDFEVYKQENLNISKRIRNLIETYGYHSDKELDVTYPCYYENIMPMLLSIRDMVGLSDEFSPLVDKEKGEEKYKAILSDIEKKVGKRTYKKVHKKIMNMRKMLWWREEYRDISTRFYYIIRVYTMELAKALVAEKILEKEEDIWFLRVSVLWDYLDGKCDGEMLRKMISQNREYYNAYRNYMSENEIGGGFNSDEGVMGDNPSSDDKEADIKGLGANSGIVRGRARVIEDFSEIGRLKENDILVTRFTDTGWTSKFAILSGIVTEYGGILCHAAIVSREYGIPAIVSCHDAMKKIKDGQMITIDGGSGVVTVEEE